MLYIIVLLLFNVIYKLLKSTIAKSAPPPMKTPAILLHKTDAMARILTLVSRAYTHWTAGQIDAKKLAAFTLKLTDRYHIDATTMQRYRAKQKGQANSELVLLQGEDNRIHWWLLATPGEGLVQQMETLADATDKKTRITMPGQDYELVMTPRKGLRASWTWRMTQATEHAWGERFKTAIRHKNDQAIRQALDSLRRVPGFREARAQAFAIEAAAKGEWQRSGKGEWPYPGVFVRFQGRFKTAASKPVRGR